MATNGNGAHQEHYTTASGVIETATSESPNSGLSKDEVGWYFVEQYYMTLSKNPEKLHLFYGKPSQFVYGPEAEAAQISTGRAAIQERIKALDLQDCKVRISNVDSQASLSNIVIQVIGETSNKGGEPKKFVQTFVLAQQPSGYFVLNDILRYLKDEGDDYPVESAPAQVEATSQAPVMPALESQPVPKAAESETVVEEQPKTDAGVADKKVEEPAVAPQTAPPVADVPEETVDEASPATSTKPEAVAEPTSDAEKVSRGVSEEKAKKPEAAKTITPVTPAMQPPAPVASEPEPPKEVAPKPRTWANLAAAAAGPAIKPALPASSKVAAPAPPQPRSSGTALPPAPQAAPAASQTPEAAATKEAASEWQTAGADSKRGTRTQSVSGPPQEKEGTLAYVKYVTEKVQDKDLRAHLSSFGEIVYFDISRSKNCAFVEFATPAGYQAAAAANPHVVNGENIIVEARRPKAGAYGGSNYNPNRGSISGRGRGGFDSSRSGSQGSGRGGFGQTRGRGTGTGAPRGRPSASQPANA